jgi:hypothetical protein
MDTCKPMSDQFNKLGEEIFSWKKYGTIVGGNMKFHNLCVISITYFILQYNILLMEYYKCCKEAILLLKYICFNLSTFMHIG